MVVSTVSDLGHILFHLTSNYDKFVCQLLYFYKIYVLSRFQYKSIYVIELEATLKYLNNSDDIQQRRRYSSYLPTIHIIISIPILCMSQARGVLTTYTSSLHHILRPTNSLLQVYMEFAHLYAELRDRGAQKVRSSE